MRRAIIFRTGVALFAAAAIATPSVLAAQMDQPASRHGTAQGLIADGLRLEAVAHAYQMRNLSIRVEPLRSEEPTGQGLEAYGMRLQAAANAYRKDPQEKRSEAGSAAPSLATALAQARSATAKYVSDLQAAKKDGYRVITRMIPNMGWHYLNPSITTFDVRKPAILVYERLNGRWQLGALEWVFPKRPAKPPLPGARYGSFGAACHYTDGSFVFADTQDQCAKTNPETGAAFGFWHGPLVTMHVWAWYPNPKGLFAELNPLISVFNKG